MVSAQRHPQLGRWERAYHPSGRFSLLKEETTEGGRDIWATLHGKATNASNVSKGTRWGTVERVECMMARKGRPPLRPRSGRQERKQAPVRRGDTQRGIPYCSTWN